MKTKQQRHREKAPAAAAWLGWNFAATSLLGAWLLFQVQPLIGKFILPWFGGCPAVWTTCMLFFQALLFGGYALAHFLQRVAPPRWQTVVHLGLVATAVACLPIDPAVAWKPTDQSLPTWRILSLLTVSVGLPYFALAATSPLVQVWFSRSYPGRSPYRLYALSNFGSLAALLSYPLWVEPAFALPGQSRLWSVGFMLYAALCAAGAVGVWRLRLRPIGLGDGPREIAPPTWRRRALWLLLPACASWMLLAATNHVCQDVAVVPLLWVVPLALYLVSFILCFDHPRWYHRGVWSVLALSLIVLVSAMDFLHAWAGFSPNYLQDLLVSFGVLLAVCMVCHGELVRLRPEPRRLTEFYLYVAAGGVLGGVLVALAAPLVFHRFLEWPIGLVLSYVLAAIVLLLPTTVGGPWLVRLVGGASAAVGLVCVLCWQVDLSRPVERVRNFYGVLAVRDDYANDPAHHQFSLVHAATMHGRQMVDPAKRRLPTSYYAEQSGVGRALRWLQKRQAKMRVGVVGLGVGTLAAYARPGDEYQFYEINPEVPRLARTYFHYLEDCRGSCDIVPGDARLSLDRQPPQHFDLLAIDAFSGDSIPIHLLTREAFQLYQRHLAPGGVLAVHITNNYLNLAPVVRAAAEDRGLLSAQVYFSGEGDPLADVSDWMLVTRNADLLRAISPVASPRSDNDVRVPLWTDQYSNLFRILTRK